MLTFSIICGILSLIALFVFFCGERDEGTMAACLLFGMTSFAFFDAYKEDKTPPVTTTSRIYGINLKDKTVGSFFLGSGYIDGRESYVFYQTTDNANEFVRKHVDTENTIVREIDGMPKHIETCHVNKCSHVIEVPKNTIIKQIDVRI